MAIKRNRPLRKSSSRKTEATTDTTVDPLFAKGQELLKEKELVPLVIKLTQSNWTSNKDIAKIYKEKGASIAAFINEEGEPIVDPSQYEN